MPKKKTSAEMDREIAGIMAQSRGDRLVYHSIGADGAPWPDWLRAYKAWCGAYVIRDKSSKSVLYVGSSKSKLYDTITRHFQQWKRRKNWWKGLHGARHDPGLVYSRSHCEVAVRLVSCGEHLELEAKLIKQLRPRDNLVERPDGELEEAPF